MGTRGKAIRADLPDGPESLKASNFCYRPQAEHPKVESRTASRCGRSSWLFWVATQTCDSYYR
jgi:hypothetical protein